MTAYGSAAYALILKGRNEGPEREVIYLSYGVADFELEGRFLTSQLRLYLSPAQDVPSQFSKMKVVAFSLTLQLRPGHESLVSAGSLGEELPALVSSRPGPGSDSLGEAASFSCWMEP